MPLLPGRAAVHQALPSSVGASVQHAAGFMAADGSGAAAQLTGGCGVPGNQGPTRVPPVQGRWAMSPGPMLPGDIHLPSMTGCWKVPLPHQALLYKRSRAEVMLPVLLTYLTLWALPEPTIPTGHAMAAGVWDIQGPAQVAGASQ